MTLWKRRATAKNDHTPGDMSLLSLLSLKLLLLAFFILLNALSDLEALKVKAVLESVTKAFEGRLVVEENASVDSAAQGPLRGAEIFLKQLGSLFEPLLPLTVRRDSPNSSLLVVELPVGVFFVKGERQLQASREAFLDRLAERLRDPRFRTLDYELTIFHARREGEGVEGLPGERISLLANKLLLRGVAKEKLLLGFYRGDAERLKLEFLVKRGPLNPKRSGLSGPIDSGEPRR